MLGRALSRVARVLLMFGVLTFAYHSEPHSRRTIVLRPPLGQPSARLLHHRLLVIVIRAIAPLAPKLGQTGVVARAELAPGVAGQTEVLRQLEHPPDVVLEVAFELRVDGVDLARRERLCEERRVKEGCEPGQASSQLRGVDGEPIVCRQWACGGVARAPVGGDELESAASENDGAVSSREAQRTEM